MEKQHFDHRHIARVVLEADTPLSIGSGRKNILTDSLVMTDCNGLPYIPGTSLAGIFRSGCSDADSVFGFAGKSNDDGYGSRIIFSEAKMLGHDGRPVDGLKTREELSDSFYDRYRRLPVRQHVRIDGRGVAADTGKFDEQVVYKGTRFCFEVEMLSDGSESGRFEEILRMMLRKSFRVGGGTRSGFGKMKVVECRYRDFNLKDKADFDAWLSRSSSLSDQWPDGTLTQILQGDSARDCGKDEPGRCRETVYSLNFSPVDFFMFGSGFGDDAADMTPVKESVVEWSSGIPHFEGGRILIPATSLKGALAHRTEYHFNRLKGAFADTGVDNGQGDYVKTLLFGSEETGDDTSCIPGCVFFSDIIVKDAGADSERVLNHVKIDRFSGAPIDGALFNEKVLYAPELHFATDIVVEDAFGRLSGSPDLETAFQAFENALGDLCRGMLPLGGGVNRGHGRFVGSCSKNGEGLFASAEV